MSMGGGRRVFSFTLRSEHPLKAVPDLGEAGLADVIRPRPLGTGAKIAPLPKNDTVWENCDLSYT